MSVYPRYAQPHSNELPKGGPDRVRFCVWYAEALDSGLADDEARARARSLMRFFYICVSMGCAEQIGPTAGGVPVDYTGETDT